jgi:putative hydrolase of the HAD superfamily
MFAVLPPNPRMLAVARRLRAAGVRTALLSNTWGGAEGHDEAALADLFDTLLLSHEVAMRKPEPAIYALAARRLGVPVGACVVVDDLITNVLGARAAGMHAILHEADATTVAELEELFGVTEAVR